MNRQEQMQFVDAEVRPLWPQWTPTEAELCVWMRELGAFDYRLARRAVQNCFAEQTVHARRPLLGRFLAKAKALSRPTGNNHRRESRDPTTNVFLECAEPPEGKPHLAGVRKPVYVWPRSKQSDPDYVLSCAESMRNHFNRLYPGRWIIVRSTPSHGMTGRLCQTQKT